WLEPDAMLERALPALPEGLRGFAERTIEAWRRLPPDPHGRTYGLFDGHGREKAVEHPAPRPEGRSHLPGPRLRWAAAADHLPHHRLARPDRADRGPLRAPDRPRHRPRTRQAAVPGAAPGRVRRAPGRRGVRGARLGLGGRSRGALNAAAVVA